jgi:sucrose phosphorylase
MIQYEPHTIKERLNVLYNDQDAAAAYEGIKDMINRYRETIRSTEYHLSEKDAILITYADQVQSPAQPPLETLHQFLSKNIQCVINSVHLLPFYPFSSDDGFSVVDYKEVDPHFGSWREVEAMGEDFRLMFDAVINHVSQFSNWFTRYLDNDPEYADFFVDIDPSTNLTQVVRPRASPLLHEFDAADGTKRHIWTTFSKDQVDLNYGNYKVLLAVLDALFFYIEKGATLLRLDAIAFVWKKLGTPSVHLPETHELIQLMREVLHKVAPEVIIITETNVPHHENVSYFGDGDDEAQMVYNFALPPLLAHSILTTDTSVLTSWAKTLRLPTDKVCFFNFTASHDGVGVRPVSEILLQEDIERLEAAAKASGGLVSYRTNPDGSTSPYELNCSYIDLLSPPILSDDIRISRMLVTQAAVLAMPGVPGIYFHSLFGSRNYHEGVKKTGVNRSINREKFNVKWLWHQIETEGTLERKLFLRYRRLLEVRINESAFNPFGPFLFMNLGAQLFCVHHESTELDSHILTIHNFADYDVTVTLPEYLQLPAMELISAKQVHEREVTIEPYGILWLKSSVDEERFTKCCNDELAVIDS